MLKDPRRQAGRTCLDRLGVARRHARSAPCAQAIALLDTLDKDINTFVMRVREWYSWHFPELVKIVNDNYQVQLTGCSALPALSPCGASHSSTRPRRACCSEPLSLRCPDARSTRGWRW